jgi:Zn-finger nucleic acid-binding protein
MDCPRDLVEMKEIVGKNDVTFQLCDTCGGVWIDGADLTRLLLHHSLPGLDSMGGRANVDELTDRCPKDQVDLIVIEGGDKGDPLAYDLCEACGGIWLDLQAAEGADADEITADIVDFFHDFRPAIGSARLGR